MNGGGIQAGNDEDEDIYKDIGDFRYDRELTKLEESNKAYLDDIARLSKRINELTERNEELQNVNDILATNISILLKTAKAEIKRKQLVIDEFRIKVESIGRRHGRNEKIHSLQFQHGKKSVDEVVEGNCKMSDASEGEIVEESEDQRTRSDRGRRDCTNSRDRGYHHQTRLDSRERLKGRLNDACSGRRKSRYSDNNYARYSSCSRNRRRSTSPDRRRYSDDRNRSDGKIKRSSRSGHSRSSSTRKSEPSPHRKEEQSRKSRERRRSVTKTDSETFKKEISTDYSREENSNKTDCAKEIKSKVVKLYGAKKNEKEEENEENCSVAKSVTAVKHHRRKSNDGSSQKKSECDLLQRQSILDCLYDEAAEPFPETPKDVADQKIASERENNNATGVSDWPTSDNKSKNRLGKGPKTLYTRRMEAKFQQQQQMEEVEMKKKNSIESTDEKPMEIGTHSDVQETSGHTTENDAQVEKTTGTEKDGGTENKSKIDKEEITSADSNPEGEKEEVPETAPKSSEVNADPAFGESLVKKLLQLQTTEENVGISEFSPLKNNYKLLKISPLKPVSKQHILEYYNLKPSTQQLTNVEPDILDFSLTLPETPGKNFFNSFLALNDTKDCISRENDSDEKHEENIPKEEKPMGEGKSGGESSIDDLIAVLKTGRTKKRSCKTAKGGGDVSSSDSKKPEDVGQGKSYQTRYHIRTRSKAENDKVNANETEDEERDVRSINGSEEEGGGKRQRRLTLSDEVDLGFAPKRMKCDIPGTGNGTSIEMAAEGNVPDDITSFEVFRSVSDENVESLLGRQATRIEEKDGVEDVHSWNVGDFTASKTVSNEDGTGDKGKRAQSFSSAGNSGDSSSNFKVLRSYLMLSANDDTDDEAFTSDNSSTGSGEYSDSGASALVDLL